MFVLIVHLISLVVAQTVDPCGALGRILATKSTITHQAVRNCYHSFSYSKTRATSLVDSLTKLSSMYVFLDYAVKPAKLSLQEGLNVRRLLRNSRNQHYSDDWAFHDAISRNMIKANDGHLEYAVSCYGQFTFYQPFFLVAIVDNRGKTRIVVHSVDMQLPFPAKVHTFQGAEIVTIDGQPVQRVLHQYARNFIGKCKGLRTRFIKTLAYRYWDDGQNQFRNDRGHFSKRTRLPDKPDVTYGIRTVSADGQKVVEQVTVPWVVTKKGDSKPFTSGAEYFKAFCEYDPSKELQSKRDGLFKKSRRKATKLVLGKRSVTQPFAHGPGFAFFSVGSKVAVLVMTTFATPTKQWAAALYEGFRKVQQQGITRLLLDLSNNGGGNICQANMLLAILDPSPTAPFPIPRHPYETSVRYGSLLKKLQTQALLVNETKSSFRIGRYLNPSTYQRFSHDDFGYKKQSVRRKAAKRTTTVKGTWYSRRFMDNCTISTPLANLKLSMDKIAVLTNGFCASSCAIVAGNLQETKRATTLVTVVGSYPSPPLYSFAGGQLMTSDDVFKFMRTHKMVGDSDLPVTFPMQGILRMTFRQIYSIRQKKVPLEYYRQKADIRLPVTASNVMSPEATWKDALEALGWLPSTPSSNCNLPNSVFCGDKYQRSPLQPLSTSEEKDPLVKEMIQADNKNEQASTKEALDSVEEDQDAALHGVSASQHKRHRKGMRELY